MGYSADKSPLIGHVAGPIRRLKPLGSQASGEVLAKSPHPRGASCNNATLRGHWWSTHATDHVRRQLVSNSDFRHGLLGKALVKDALLRTAAAADIAGIRALLVHAKDDEALGWYEALEFEPSPTDPYHLFLLMKDLRAMLSE